MNAIQFLKGRLFGYLAITFCIFSVFVLFQNCNRATLFSNSSSSSNNGAGYGGMQSDQYYRFAPRFTCENKVAAVKEINFTDTSITLIENKKLACGAVTQSLDRSAIDSSIYQNDIIGYQEGIFEGARSTPTSIPTNLVEVWCRDKVDQTGIENIVHFDRDSNLAVNRTYYATTASDGNFTNQVIPDFTVARVVANKTVTIRDGKGFELIVRRDRPAPQVGLFIGELSAIIDGKNLSRKTYCRLGGSLDPNIWPAKQIVDFNVLFFKNSPDVNHFSYTSKTGTGNNALEYLYISNIDGNNQFKVSTNLTSTNSGFTFTPNSNKLIYVDDFISPSPLMSINTDGSSHISLDNGNVGVFKISEDGLDVVYNRTTQVVSPFGVGLYSVGINDGLIRGLAPNVTSTVVANFDVTPNKVAFFDGGSIFSNNIDGTDLTEITPLLPANWSYTAKICAPNTGSILSVWAITNGSSANYVIAEDGSWSLQLPAGWDWVSTSPSGLYGVLVNEQDGVSSMLINLKTGTTTNLPPSMWGSGQLIRDGNQSYASVFFTADSTAYVGLRSNSAKTSKNAVSISVSDGSITELCPGIAMSFIKERSPHDFLMAGFDTNTKLLNIYSGTNEHLCKKINSVPLSITSLSQISVSISPDNQNILAVIRGMSINTPMSQLLYIPLNGLPSYQVDTPVYPSATIQKAIFLNDSSTVLFIGDQTRPGDNNIFLWSAPQKPR